MSRPRLAELTLDAPGETVLRLAGYVARKFDSWGALERADYVGAACLAFYEAATRWSGEGCFGGYALRYMDGAVRQLRLVEARHQKGWLRAQTRPSSKDVHTLSHRGNRIPSGSSEGGCSVSLEAQTRRRVSRREHNRTYYYRTHERVHCRDCDALIERGHGARRCALCAARHEAVTTAAWRAQRDRAARRNLCACGCGTLVRNKWAHGHHLTHPMWLEQRELQRKGMVA